VPCFGEKPLEAIDRRDVEAFAHAMLRKPARPLKPGGLSPARTMPRRR
jgi:hypothetical protein